MPEISRFLGMVVLQWHNPPHFHVQYNEYQAAILIENLGVMEGELPAKALSLVVEWGQEHQEELLALEQPTGIRAVP